MSEQLKQHHEHHEHQPSHEHLASAEHHKQAAEKAAEQSAAEAAEKLEAIHKTIEKEAKSKHEVPVDRVDRDNGAGQLAVNRELKSTAFHRLLSHTRKQLSGPDRLLSDFTHQPVVDAVSNVAEKTVARPMPLLGAGLFALVGSTILLYMAKHYGFRYNLSIFFALFAIGFAVGLLFDALRLMLRRRAVR